MRSCTWPVVLLITVLTGCDAEVSMEPVVASDGSARACEVVSTSDGFNGEVEPAKNQEPTRLELGDGVVLKESVFRSAKGDVRVRMTTQAGIVVNHFS